MICFLPSSRLFPWLISVRKISSLVTTESKLVRNTVSFFKILPGHCLRWFLDIMWAKSQEEPKNKTLKQVIKVRKMLRKLCLQRSTTTWKSRAHDTTRCWWRFLLRFPYLTTHPVNNSIAHSLPGYLSSAGKAPLLFCDDRLLVIVRKWLLFFL